MAYKPTAEDFDFVEKRASYNPSASDFSEENGNGVQSTYPYIYSLAKKISEHPYLSKIVNKAAAPAGVFSNAFESTGLPSFAGGALQGAADTGISLANIPLDIAGYASGKDLSIPHPDLSKYNDGGIIPSIAFGLGDIAGSIPGGAGAYSAASKLLPKASGYAGMLSKALAGGISGAAINEGQYGGRTAGAILGSAAAPISSLTTGSIAKKIINDKNAVKSKYKEEYSKLFDDAVKRNIAGTKIKKPSIDLNRIVKNSDKKYHKSLVSFYENPSIDGAHKAQSDLGKYIRRMDKLSESNPLTFGQIKSVEEASNAMKKIKGSMFKYFNDINAPELARKYSDITKGYANDVIPYSSNKHINLKEKGKISNKTLVDKIGKNEEFMLSAGKKYPEIKINKKATSLAKSLAKLATAGAIGGETYHLLKGNSGE